MQDRADGPRLLRRIVVFFQLAEYLRFADDHGIEARRNPEYMSNCIGISKAVEMFGNGVWGNLMKLAEELAD